MKIPKRIVSALIVSAIIVSNTVPTVVSAMEALNNSNLEVNETIAENKVLATDNTEVSETGDTETTEDTDVLEVKDNENIKNTEVVEEVENESKDADIEVNESIETSKNTKEQLLENKTSLTIEKAIENTVDYYKNHNNKLSEFWHLVGLKSVGEDITKSPYKLPQWDASLINEETTVIGDAGYILGIIARGEDPKNFHGKNVAELLASKQKYYYEYNSSTGQYDKNEWGFGSFNGANANIWAIIALEIANQEYDREYAFNTLLECQNSTSGGFGLSASWSSTDMTGMALIALSYFRNDPAFSDKANESIEKALGYIHRAKNDNGTFNTSDKPGVEDGNSTSMAITGLLSVGEDLDNEKWSNVKTGLLELQLTEDTTITTFMGEEQHYKGEFYWRKPNQINDTATKQALVALGDLIDGETAWKQLEREYDEIEAKREELKLPKIIAQTIRVKEGDKIDDKVLLNGVKAEDKDGNDISKDIKVKHEIPLNGGIVTKAGLYIVTYEVEDGEGRKQTKAVDIVVEDIENLEFVEGQEAANEVIEKLESLLKEVDENGDAKYSLIEKLPQVLDDEKILYTFILSENKNKEKNTQTWEIRIILPKDASKPEVTIPEINNPEDDNNGGQGTGGNDQDDNNGGQGTGGNDQGDNTDAPKTGDTSILGAGLLSIVSMAGLGIINRKRK